MPYAAPTLRSLIARARAELLAVPDRLPLRRSVEDVLARVLAGIAWGLHGRAAWLERQMLPDRATGTRLDQWARLYGLERTQPAKASGLALFIVDSAETIPVGTRMRDDDGHTFLVVEPVEPVDYGAGFTTAAIEAEEPGADQNLPQDTRLYLLEPIAGVTSPGAVYGDLITDSPPFALEGGSDLETDEQLRRRIIARMSDPPRGGAPGDYEAWAKEAGADWAWERVERSGAGTVDVYVLIQSTVTPASRLQPSASQLAEIQDYLDEHSPVTIAATAVSPAVSSVLFEMSITPDTAETRAAVEAELDALFWREAEVDEGLLRSHIQEAIQLAEGVASHTLTTPAADVAGIVGTVRTRGAISFV